MKLPILILVLGALGWCASLLFGQSANRASDDAQTTYYASGQMESKTAYVDGKRQGTAERWYTNGTKMSEGRYEDNRMVGEWRFWNADGSEDTQRSGNYENGEKVATAAAGHEARQGD
jgi:antitoxin component YwqK of YwqJK toxin-antitoxin module